MSYSCIIIDDEPNAIKLLEMFIAQTGNWQLKAKCYDAIEAMQFLKTNKVDFIFLDINMPRLSGMELAGLLPQETKIVFTTAYSEYAAESYGFSTIDYLLKPITLKRFLAAKLKIENYFASSQQTVVPESDDLNEYFFVKSGKTLRKVLLNDILYFEGEKEYVRIVTSEQQFLIYKRIKEVEEQVNTSFVRVHNSYIVNIKQINKIEGNLLYIGTKQIPVSDKFKDKFMSLVQKRIF
ncbi:LytR/AlgR family response regulator transcription factor [Chitinophagaceae bacterium LWZ2-11]